MHLAPYTDEDFCANTPCLYRYRENYEHVIPIMLGPVRPFTGARLLTVRCGNGYVFSRNLGGYDNATSFYKGVESCKS